MLMLLLLLVWYFLFTQLYRHSWKPNLKNSEKTKKKLYMVSHVIKLRVPKKSGNAKGPSRERIEMFCCCMQVDN